MARLGTPEVANSTKICFLIKGYLGFLDLTRVLICSLISSHSSLLRLIRDESSGDHVDERARLLSLASCALLFLSLDSLLLWNL